LSEIAQPGRIAFVGGYEPRRCGIATFTRDLCEAVASAIPEAECIAGAVNDRTDGYRYPPRVRFELLEKDLDSYRRAADFLNFNNTEVLCVQHEFGIYGGSAGSHLLALLKEVRMPVVTTLHTVLQNPDPAQRKVMEELISRSDRLVVMARKGAEILRDIYGVPDSQIDVIPHGIPDVPFSDPDDSKGQFGLEGRKVLLTFGLLGPGKGIEHVIVHSDRERGELFMQEDLHQFLHFALIVGLEAGFRKEHAALLKQWDQPADAVDLRH